MQSIQDILSAQRNFFESSATLPIRFRKQMLKRLYNAVKAHEKEIAQALLKDLGKSGFEGFMCESGMALAEIGYMIRHVKGLSRRKRVKTPLAQFYSKSFVKPCPYGTVLVMSPWNYPFMLSIDPIADAIAAGNTVVVKPSAYSPATSALIERIIGECFPAEYVAVITGGREQNKALLEEKFDLIFFTGSQSVGKEVLRHAAEHLTPAVLELGGKSPCIVDSSASLALAARRIVFGKFLNCGQTCVAPDFVLCERSVKDKLLSHLITEIKRQYGKKPLENPSYGKIVSQKHFERIVSLIDEKKVVFGGKTNTVTGQIEPTVMDGVTLDDAVMGEEIFGPVLPILTFESFDELAPMLAKMQKPLALYLFSHDKHHIKEFTERFRFGGGCINDTVIHLATSEMGFGGVGESGMGAYHGKVGFDTFSHKKSVVDKKTLIDLPMRYQPYRRFYEKLLHLFLK